MESGNSKLRSWKAKNTRVVEKRLSAHSLLHFLFSSSPPPSFPATMLSKMLLLSKQNSSGAVPVYLNVYDLTPINGYAYWLGLGVYHSGVQVHGVEYAFGAHEQSATGIFEVEPKNCPGFTFRKSILIGRTDLGCDDVGSLMEKLAEDYSGNAYHLITNNCNHFCSDVCVLLTGKPIPSWVNRLARLGSLCNCVLPAGLNQTKVRDARLEDKGSHRDKKKLRSHSSRFTSSSDISALASSARTGRQRRCLPRSSSLIHTASTSSVALKL